MSVIRYEHPIINSLLYNINIIHRHYWNEDAQNRHRHGELLSKQRRRLKLQQQGQPAMPATGRRCRLIHGEDDDDDDDGGGDYELSSSSTLFPRLLSGSGPSSQQCLAVTSNSSSLIFPDYGSNGNGLQIIATIIICWQIIAAIIICWMGGPKYSDAYSYSTDVSVEP